jgi:hypothetical protein
MKYNKIIKLTVCALVINLFFMDEQYCSERSLISRMFGPRQESQPLDTRYQSNNITQVHHVKSYTDKQRINDAMRDKYLDKYVDYDTVMYWTSDDILQRIKENKSSYKASVDEILDYVINLDMSLKDDEDDYKRMLFKRECHEIMMNDQLDSDQKNNLYEYMQLNEEKVKNELWLQRMYSCKDAIHKKIEKTKFVGAYQESYCAWPYIKEIARLKKFS